MAKDVTGYNMVQLMVGSEGTLGIFTKRPGSPLSGKALPSGVIWVTTPR